MVDEELPKRALEAKRKPGNGGSGQPHGPAGLLGDLPHAANRHFVALEPRNRGIPVNGGRGNSERQWKMTENYRNLANRRMRDPATRVFSLDFWLTIAALDTRQFQGHNIWSPVISRRSLCRGVQRDDRE
jgi:hypothetical protein